MRASPITTTIDFDRVGVQHGYLKLPHSWDESAWGSILIPITVVRNGDGPTALLTGGNHGDEYEGPIALFDLANTLAAEEITGRVIIVPALNYPAFRAGRRTSPIDNGNLNRVFPGRPEGTVTEKIADYVQRHLLPMADLVLDIHSGGRTLDFVPFAAVHALEDKAQQARSTAARDAFNAPYGVTLLEPDNVGMFDTAAEDMGKVFVSTELGGGGSARASTTTIAKRGLRNVLRHLGVLPGQPTLEPAVILDMPDARCFVTSESRGLLEVTVDIGGMVAEGEILARVYDIERTGTDPVEYRARIDGILVGRHFPGLVAMGDIVGVIAVPTEGG
jgi:N-alpha-acetyl-L-2,4-diaminobutyrate deacetylase